jgi:hypothetical protein
MFSILYSRPWSVTKARNRIRKIEPRLSVDQAFELLRGLCAQGFVPGRGFPALDHPGELERRLADGHQPFVDPPQPTEIKDIPPSEWPGLSLDDDGSLCDADGVPMWDVPEIDSVPLIALRQHIKLPVVDVEPPSQAVKNGATSPVAEHISLPVVPDAATRTEAPKYKRGGCDADMEEWLARRNVEWVERMSDEGLTRKWLDNHSERQKENLPVPVLPVPDHRVSQLTKRMALIRARRPKAAEKIQGRDVK